MQLFHDLLNIIIISSRSVGQIKRLNGPHMGPGPQFAHACQRLAVYPGVL